MPSRDFRTGRHVVYNLNAHLVFIPKYRRKVITARVFDVLQRSWREVCAHFESTLVESNFEPDHVHLLVKYPPKVAISNLVNSLKGVSARRIRQANFPEVQQMLWGKHFWSPSYCVVSCGGAPLEIIQRYIQEQARDETVTPCSISNEELANLFESPTTEESSSSPA